MPKFEKLNETLKKLPVSSIADDVVKSTLTGNVTILAAPTGSGKSMLVPAKLADATDEQVIVLVPRRFLATDAAKNVSQMAGTEVGHEVGYAIGGMNGEKSLFSDNTKLLFMTYGYAIRSGLINTAKNIVLDEVHEAAEDISLARAILHTRKEAEPDLRLLEMSATIDATKQAGFWKDIAETSVHSVEGHTLQCEQRRQIPGKQGVSIPQTVVNLLTKENRKGIAVFRSGVKEVEKTAEEIRELLNAQNVHNVEVVEITGRSTKDEQRTARNDPKPGWRKIIVGTNVIESGVNLRWVDSGISDGTGKIPYDRHDTGAEALIPENLPQWRIVQQFGRINRDPTRTGFNSGIFILHSNTDIDARPDQQTPELERLALNNFAFHAASLGHAPDQLKLDARIDPDRWHEAQENLIRLGLIDENWQLTTDGEYVSKLPISPETGAMLCEAKRLDIAAIHSRDPELKKRPKLLPEAIIIAAIFELGQFRDDFKRGHGQDGKSDVHGGSDLVDSLKAYQKLVAFPEAKLVADPEATLAEPHGEARLEAARNNMKAHCKKENVDYRTFCDTMSLVSEITGRHKDKKSVKTETHYFDQARYNDLKQIILNGNANRLFQLEENGHYRDLLRDYDRRKNDKGELFNDYPINQFSAIAKAQETSRTPLLVGNLREWPDKSSPNGDFIPMLDNVTSIPSAVFLKWAAERATVERNMPVLDKVSVKQDQDFTSRYAGKATFTIPTTRPKLETTHHIAALKKSVMDWSKYVENAPKDVRRR